MHTHLAPIAMLLKCHLPGCFNFYCTGKQSAAWHKILVSTNLRKMSASRWKTYILGRCFLPTKLSLWSFHQSVQRLPQMRSRRNISRWSHDHLGKSCAMWSRPACLFFFPLLSPGRMEVWAYKGNQGELTRSHNRVDGSPRGALDGALSTLILNIQAMGVPPLPSQDYPTV